MVDGTFKSHRVQEMGDADYRLKEIDREVERLMDERRQLLAALDRCKAYLRQIA